MPKYKRETRLTREDLLRFWDEGESTTVVNSREELLSSISPATVELWIESFAGATNYHPLLPHFADRDMSDWQSLESRRPDVRWRPRLDPATSG